MLNSITLRSKKSSNEEFTSQLQQLRCVIDELDSDLLQILAKRFEIIDKIGEYKRDNNVTILQIERWLQILNTRGNTANLLGLSDEFVKQLLELIHNESIRLQTEIMNEKIKLEK